MFEINFSVFDLLLTALAYGPLAYVYFALAIVCWKQGISEPPAQGMHPASAAIGQTFCALWILFAPFLLALLAILFGKKGTCLWNVGCFSLFWAMALFEEKRRPLLAYSLLVVGGLCTPLAILIGMPK